MATRFTIESVFRAIDKVTVPVSRIQNRVLKFTHAARRGFRRLNRAIGKVTSNIKHMAMTSGFAFVGIGFALRSLIATGADFGRAISLAAAKFPGQIKRGTKEFFALKTAARDVGATTEFTATQAAHGLNFMAKAGFNAKFSIAALRDMVDFATASELELGEASDFATDALGAFGLNVGGPKKKLENLKRVMDVMVLTSVRTNTSVAQLFETIKDGAPVAIKAGQSLETVAAVAGVLAGAGIKGGRAGTAIKNISLAIAGVGNHAAKTFDALKIKLSDKGKLRDIADVFNDLSVSLSGMDEDKILPVMKAIFGKISLASAMNLLGRGSEGIKRLRKEFLKGKDASKNMADFIRDDVRGSIDGLFSSIESVKISINELNEGPLKDAIDKMTDWIRTNEELIATNMGGFLLSILNNLPEIVTWMKRIGIGLVVFFTLASILKTIGIILAIIALPFGGVVLAVLALVAAFTALVIWIDDINDAFNNMPMAIQLILSKLGLLIKSIKLVKDFFSGELGAKLGEFIFNLTNEEHDPNKPVTSNMSRVVSPQDRVARSIEEQRTTNTAEVTLTADEGTKAEVTKGKLGPSLILQSSGAM
jgi:TP901 family phage tail tape measure protein